MQDETVHRQLAVAAHNRSWELLERDRDAAEQLELLEAAFTSRHHWRVVGGAQQLAIADWMVARCFAELGEGTLALTYARAAIAAQPPDAPAWLRASLLEGLARAHAALGDGDARNEAVALAQSLLQDEQDEEDRTIIAEQLATVPAAVTPT
jgi:hypothetical protein